LSQNQVVYIYNLTYYFVFPIPIATINLLFNENTNTIYIEQQFFSYLYTFFNSSLKFFFKTVVSVFFKKIKFKGKGYYVYKTLRNTIAPQFNYAHRVYVYSFYVSVRFLSKTSILLFGFSTQDMMTIGTLFRSKRPINVFTGRGVRFAKQIIYKKTGKVSAYR